MDGLAEDPSLMILVLKGLCGMLPAGGYLAVLMFLDSYKLVRLRAVAVSMLVGGLALFICFFLNGYLIRTTGMTSVEYSRYLAPVVEETVKGAYLVWLIRSRKVGFMVDAVILGFAIGAAFGIIENITYLYAVPDAPIFTWILRGFGTAVMHGSTAALLGLLYHRLKELSKPFPGAHLAGSLGPAIVLHSVYNHFFVSPVIAVLGLVLGVPLAAVTVYQRSERSLENWLGVGFDADAEMLEIINMGKVSRTRIGEYLETLRERFAPEVVADMFCLLRIQVELALEAKGILMMRKEGYELPTNPELTEKIEELDFLEKSIGATGRLAIQPLRRSSRRDTWEKELLSGG